MAVGCPDPAFATEATVRYSSNRSLLKQPFAIGSAQFAWRLVDYVANGAPTGASAPFMELASRESGDILINVTHFRISEAASLVGVSDDTIRRWAADGLLESGSDSSGRQTVTGASLAKRALDLAPKPGDDSVRQSARNRFTGIVTATERSGIVAKVELQAGPNRVVSLMTAEALDDLGIEVGSRATAIIKATNVIIEAERH